MADNMKELKAENERLKAENERQKAENAELKKQIDYTREQFVRLMSRNLDLSDRIEGDLEFRRRVDVARELIDMNVERIRSAIFGNEIRYSVMVPL